jgi:hypothetical protein
LRWFSRLAPKVFFIRWRVEHDVLNKAFEQVDFDAILTTVIAFGANHVALSQAFEFGNIDA